VNPFRRFSPQQKSAPRRIAREERVVIVFSAEADCFGYFIAEVKPA
jgi:hypothetical protein